MPVFIKRVKLIVLVMVLLPIFARADTHATISTQLMSLAEQSDILIIGEKHGKEESTKLFADLINQATQGSRCLTVALEISSGQQLVIDRAMSGNGSIAEIVVDPIIDHAGYREMLSALRGIIAEGRCLHVIAIDGTPETIDRDAWMADVLKPYVDKGKVVCLLGRLHAAKRIHWEDGRQRPFLAERLASKGYRVCSAQQLWGCKEVGGVTPLTVEDVAEILDPVAANVPDDAREFGDYAVRWK